VATTDPHPRDPFRRLVRSQIVPVSVDEAFAFFGDAANLEAITPPWLGFRILSAPAELAAGSLIEYRLHIHRVPVSWRTRIEVWEPGVRFVDLQLRGPYAHWEHSHEFAAVDGGTLLTDVVRYRLPLGPLGALAHVVLVRRDLDRIFDYRREAIARRLGQPAR
jgi:ligand-binding SRPBCC domain-containing protein